MNPGDVFRIKGRRGRWEVLEVRAHDVLAYGGSTQPWGRRGFRSFRVDEDFELIKESA